MPSSCDSSDPGSPSLVNVLRQFRFTKKKCHGLSGDDQAEENHCSTSKPGSMQMQCPQTPPSREKTEIPETPENVIKQEGSHGAKGSQTNGYVSPESSATSESPIVAPKPKHPVRLLSDTEPESATPEPASTSTSNTEAAHQDYDDYYEDEENLDSEEFDVFTEKEKSLRRLMNRYRNKDLMQLQDILVANDWNVARAIAHIEGRPPPPPRAPRPQQQQQTPTPTSTSVCPPQSCSPASKTQLSETRPNLSHSDSVNARSNLSNLTVSTRPSVSSSPSSSSSSSSSSCSASQTTCEIVDSKAPTLVLNTQVKTEPPSPPSICDDSEKSDETKNSTVSESANSAAASPASSSSSTSSTASLRAYRRTFPPTKTQANCFDVVAKDAKLNVNTVEINRTYSKEKKIVLLPSERPKMDDDDDQCNVKQELSDDEENSCSVDDLKPNTSKESAFDALLRNDSKVPNECSVSGNTKSAFDVLMKNDKKAPVKRKAFENKAAKDKRRRIEIICADDSDDNEYHNDYVYDSDDSDCGNDEVKRSARSAVMSFLDSATLQELIGIPKCSKKKAENIIEIRPFTNWDSMVQKFKSSKYLTPDILNGVRQLLNTREVITRLMKRCLRISEDIGQQVEKLLEEGSQVEGCITEQPTILNEKMRLAPYQMLGLNWLVLIHNNQLNGILADEMGLGKTVQAIAFLAYLQQQKEETPHLVVVPSSTMDNWIREFQTWCPALNVFCYHGPQELRRELRMQILNDEIDDFDVIVTTYNMVTTSIEDRSLFKKMNFHYVVFDEAHMLKNMASQRYQTLMKIKAKRRLLLTGTPLQNNLVELMSLLIFVMPDMFHGKVEEVKQMFSGACKTEENRSQFERKRIEHAKRIMRPFFLRRLKNEVLKQLPKKTEETRKCPFTPFQKEKYEQMIAEFSKNVQSNDESMKTSGAGMMTQLRKAANHPLLLRHHYTDEKLKMMTQCIVKEPTHREAVPAYVEEDMQVMSDYELHRLCHSFESLASFKLPQEKILDSGKFQVMDKMLSEMKDRGDRVLLFSQFTMMLDIVEEYMSIRNYRYLRLDGTTPVPERQMLIDMFNDDEEIFIFLLSTRAGGLGINLTAANVVLLHDIDFNPYNDKQAEDRCHRVGQTREVTVIRLISENSIEEGILRCAQDKLKLEKDLTEADKDKETEEQGNVAQLLKSALGL